ncbi:SGNH/GDSL hydrolase family protein [Candidatus Poribacteria bacterium]
MSSKPSAILIGDSICMGYRPLVKERLSDQVNILGIEGNGGDSSRLLENLDEWMISHDADLIHFNCGLHDLKFERDTKAYQQPIDVYEANLRKIVERLQKGATARLVWVATTPVIDERHNTVKGFDRYQRDVEPYNRIATTIMTEAGIPIDDLHSAIQNDDVEACLGNDGVHMTERGNKVLTDAVCKCILNQLGI